MRYVKTFELFDTSQTLTSSMISVSNNYYHCDGCDSLYISPNSIENSCKFCKSNEVEELSKDEYYMVVGDRRDEI